jgi:E3 ubiquitin-protein ligase UBR1
MDSYLLVDREAENSVKYFALQLFTVPTIASYLVRNNHIIDRLHNLIIAFFTDQIANKMIEQYPRADLTVVNVDSFPFKSKRFMPMFSDLRYICSNASVQALIASNESYISAFLRTCRLFMGVNPNRRMAIAHVEYEQEAWISVFNVTLSLSRVVKVYAEAFAQATPSMLCNVIKAVAQDIVNTCTLAHPALDRAKYEEIRWTPRSYGGATFQVVDFDVLTGWVSFHHSEHWLLAELLKHVELLTTDNLAPLGVSSFKEMLRQTMPENDVQIVIEFPLRGLRVSTSCAMDTR